MRAPATGPATAAADLRARFEDGTLPSGAFTHREHVRLTWTCLRDEEPAAVARRLCDALRRFATARGVPGKFHHTLTVAWVSIVAAAAACHPDASFDELVARCPWLIDREAPRRYYSPARLDSDLARRQWVEPDREPLPARGATPWA